MCGIAGFFAMSRDTEAQKGGRVLQGMTDAIAHRGPDADGAWSDAEQGIFLGHRRLSILDLSPAGAQPMTSHDGRYVMVFNGEIYNAPSLQKDLYAKFPEISFRGHSDTEILLEGFARLGFEETLRRIKGMFALALWDRQEKVLRLCRDHLGKKPLYYGMIGTHFVFASELKAIKAFGGDLKINRAALAGYMRFGLIRAPQSIYQGIYKLEAAHQLTVSAQGQKKKSFWALEKNPAQKPYDPQELKRILQDAVKGRMMADVPLGAFLSGGIDSSLVTALMQEQSNSPVKTYSIGFDDARFDESGHAEKIAAHLGCDHTTYKVTAEDCLKVIPRLAHIYDEPFADYSQIPSIVLCEKARADTTVALSGDGGDEFFCGYARYFMLKKLLEAKAKIPPFLRPMLSQILQIPSQRMYNAAGLNGKRLHTIAGLLGEKDLKGEILRTLSISQSVKSLTGIEDELCDYDEVFADESLNDFEKMMFVDAVLYLPDDILVKVDRASMASSLEVRSPLLDKDVIEYARTVPVQEKIRSASAGKKPLYDLLCTYVPKEMIDRPKQGFTPPIAGWLRGDLKEWARDMLSLKTDLFDEKQVLKMWDEFESGKADHHAAIWAVLMAQSCAKG